MRRTDDTVCCTGLGRVERDSLGPKAASMRRPYPVGVARPYRHASVVWLMALLVLFAALAPTVSKVLASTEAAGGVWIEVCSANGTKLVQVDMQDGAAEEPNSIQADHCPFCLPHFQFRGVPPADTSLPVYQFVCGIALCLPESELILAHNQWRPDRSRAPPSIS